MGLLLLCNIIIFSLQTPVSVINVNSNGHVNDDKLKQDDSISEESYDPWAVDTETNDDGKDWKEMSCGERFCYVLTVLIKVSLILGFLYLFICALGFLGDAFKLVGGKTAGKAFREDQILNNPVAGLMLGVLATVLLQSSSTTTSIIITMVGSDIIPVKTAIPMVMGANIGTSVTNTIVSLTQSGDREVFRRAFGGATVHDMFNWLTVFILLPIEAAFHYLYHLTSAIRESMHFSKSGVKKEFLTKITKPFTKLIVSVDKNVIKKIAMKDKSAEQKSVLKRWCKSKNISYNGTVEHSQLYNSSLTTQLNRTNVDYSINISPLENQTFISWETNGTLTKKIYTERCGNLFAQTDLDDSTIGTLLLIISLILIVISLLFMVKLINSILKGSVAKAVKKFINSDFPGVFRHLTGYVAILVGAGLTMIIQSSSVFTSTLTPLVGVGVVSLDRMFPLTLGANIGTCVTGILAALANSPKAIPNALQISMCHLFFNLSGTILFYPIPYTRRLPINLAKGLGNITAKYRWFSIMYLILMFLALPGAIFGLSMAGMIPFAVVGGLLLLLLIVIIIINIQQRKCPHSLPKVLRSWTFLPLCCHSLRPMDSIISRIMAALCCREKPKTTDSKNNTASVNKGYDNDAFTPV